MVSRVFFHSIAKCCTCSIFSHTHQRRLKQGGTHTRRLKHAQGSTEEKKTPPPQNALIQNEQHEMAEADKKSIDINSHNTHTADELRFKVGMLSIWVHPSRMRLIALCCFRRLEFQFFSDAVSAANNNNHKKKKHRIVPAMTSPASAILCFFVIFVIFVIVVVVVVDNVGLACDRCCCNFLFVCMSLKMQCVLFVHNTQRAKGISVQVSRWENNEFFALSAHRVTYYFPRRILWKVSMSVLCVCVCVCLKRCVYIAARKMKCDAAARRAIKSTRHNENSVSINRKKTSFEISNLCEPVESYSQQVIGQL